MRRQKRIWKRRGQKGGKGEIKGEKGGEGDKYYTTDAGII